MTRHIPFLTLVLLLVLPFTGQAQERPTLLVLGSAHLNNPGNDVVNLEIEDVLSERRQQEILAVVAQLAKYNPTHIVVEFPVATQDRLDARYQDYRAGNYTLTPGEDDQFGLRLAAQLDHDKVYAADWNGNPPGDLEVYDWYTWAQNNAPQQLQDLIVGIEAAGVAFGEQDMSAWLLQLNTPEALAASHQTYFDIARFGSADTQQGATWVGSWYGRNLRIFDRLTEIATTPDARLLVIYGTGHTYLLRQFAHESGYFNLVDVADVLAP